MIIFRSIFFKVVSDAIKHSDMRETSELLIIHFKWYGIIAQSAPLFASTHIHHIHHTYTIHTSFSCKWCFSSFLMCPFSSTVGLLLKVLHLIETWANVCWGRRRVSQGWQKQFRQIWCRRYALMQRLRNSKFCRLKVLIPFEKTSIQGISGR